MWFQLLVLALGLSKAFAIVNYKAIAVVNNPPVKGVLTFYQTNDGSPVEIRGDFSGLTPGNHGFHIHNYGDLSHGCESTGEHFNPFHTDHGGPHSHEHHAGDLGNLKANRRGKASFSFTSDHISLVGGNPTNVVGRSIVIHADPDDLGTGHNEESLESGNSGDRIACAVIGIAPINVNVPRGNYVPGFRPPPTEES